MSKKTTRHYGMPSVVAKLMDIDPLGEAELKTGKDYKTDKGTMALGVLELHDRRERLDEMLTMNDDTKWSNEVPEYFRIIKSEGFKRVLEVPFKGREGVDEAMFIFWHPEEYLLLVCDTYGGRHHHINASSFYFNWIPNVKKCVFPPHASGGMGSRTDEQDFTFVGHYDAREALRYKLWWLRANGSTIKWKYQPFLWPLHYMDTNGPYDYDALVAERIAQLPNEVREGICLT